MDHLQQFADIFLGLFEGHEYDGRCDVPVGSLSIDDAYEVQRRVIAGGSATTAAELKSTCCSVISACVSVEVGCEVTSFSRLSSSSGPDVVAMSVI